MKKRPNSKFLSNGTSKVCTGCLEKLPISSFGVQKNYPDGLNYRCKKCLKNVRNLKGTDPSVVLKRREAVAKYRAANPDRDVNKTLLNKYGITLKEYEEIFELQGGVCALCKKPETTRRNKKGDGGERLAVDHCHDTGVVRGLLCFKCNTAIGALGDTQKSAERAMKYLSSWVIDVSELNAK
jgi:hypothetical protein